MRRVTPFAVAWLVLGLVGFVGAQEKKTDKVEKGDKVVSRFTVLVPEAGHKETVLKIGGMATEQRGGERKFITPPLDKGFSYTYVLDAVIEPNNYTKIFRKKSVTFNAGDNLTVDLRQKDKDEKIEVRWVPTPDDIVDKMCELAKVTKDDVVYDLGCGDAVMLIRPIKKFYAKKGVGIDIDAKMIERAKENVKKAGVADRVELRVGDILNVTNKDLPDASVVLLYIGDDLGERLSPVLQKALKPGARVVSHRFHLGDWTPTETKEVTGEDGFQYTLHLWIVGSKK
jgi:uncharacterized protein (TIGR03000 family)